MRSLLVAALILLALPVISAHRFAFIGQAAAEPAWGAQVAGSFSEPQAMTDYEALQKKFPDILSGRAPTIMRGVMSGGGTGAFYNVFVRTQTRDEAETLCGKLEAAGGACVVKKADLPSQ